MVIRLWVTDLVAHRAAEYDSFANSRSLAMFKSLEGCLGVIFYRSSERAYVVSLWRDMAAIDALSTSDIYQRTVADILAAGFLREPQTTEIMQSAGGFLSPEALQALG